MTLPHANEPALTSKSSGDLSGLRIMLDARNIDMPQGTGIKTYGLALIEALQALKADVCILHGRNFSTKDNIADILFFDYHGHVRKRRFRQLRYVAPLLKGMVGSPMRAMFIASEGKSQVIVPATEKALTGTARYNARDCFRTANLLFDVLRKTQRIEIPDKIDIWHSTYVLPITIVGAKKITTIHDCIPFRLPWTTLDDKQGLYDLFRKEIAESDLVITVSESSKRDILSLFDVAPEKVQVTYEPVHLQTLTSQEQTHLESVLHQAFDLSPKKYLLYVGAIEPKKNLPRLIDAYLKIDTDLPLVIAGKKAWLWRQELDGYELRRAVRQRRIILLNYVTSEHLRYLYAGALLFTFPSLYEGFGLPPLEAMVSGVPVLTSNCSSLPEVCGSAALYVEPEDIVSIRSGIERLLGDANLRETLSKQGLEEAKKMSMENYLQRLLGAYAHVIN